MWKNRAEEFASKLKPAAQRSLKKFKRRGVEQFSEHLKRMGFKDKLPDNPMKLSIVPTVFDVRVIICPKGFKEYVFKKGDTCWCKWRDRTDKKLPWRKAADECARTAMSRRSDVIAEGETICVPK